MSDRLLTRKEIHTVAVEHGVSFLSATESDVKRFLSARANYKKKLAEKLKDERDDRTRLKETRERDSLCVKVRAYLADKRLVVSGVGLGFPETKKSARTYQDVGIVVRGDKDMLKKSADALNDFDFTISSRKIPVYFIEDAWQQRGSSSFFEDVWHRNVAASAPQAARVHSLVVKEEGGLEYDAMFIPSEKSRKPSSDDNLVDDNDEKWLAREVEDRESWLQKNVDL